MRRQRLAGVLAAAAMVAATSGCGIGLGTSGGYTPTASLAGPLAHVRSLDGATLSVGSKNFTEQIVLGKMTIILLKAAGADVKDYTNIPGSSAARQAQLTGQIQMQWDYTGTAWLTYLGHDKPIPNPHRQYVAVRDQDLKQNKLVWLTPSPMNDTYDLAVTHATAKKYGLKKLSDMSKVPVSQRTICVESEFTNRPDGLKGMLQKYGLPLGSSKGVPRGNLRTLETGAIYDATAKGDCTFGEVYTTDGRIQALHLVPLTDDRHFFPIYNGALIVRKEVLDSYPQLRQLFDPLSKKLTNSVLATLNAKVDVDGEDPATVAYDWLKKEGFVKGS